MVFIRYRFLASIVFFVGLPVRAQLMNWKASTDYSVKFSGKNVSGFFRGLDVDISFDEENPGASKISAGVNANTLNTGNGLKNKHAKSKKGLDAKNFSMITFVSTQIIKTSCGYEATGNLIIKGSSREIKLPFTFERIETDAVFKGKFYLNPKDFAVTRHGTPGTIEVDLVLRVTTK